MTEFLKMVGLLAVGSHQRKSAPRLWLILIARIIRTASYYKARKEAAGKVSMQLDPGYYNLVIMISIYWVPERLLRIAAEVQHVNQGIGMIAPTVF